MNSIFSIYLILHKVISYFGRASSYLSIVLMLVIVTDVTLRHWFVIGSTQLQELEWHLHGALFLLTLGYAYMSDSHVRIELFSEKLSNKSKAWLELVGICIFLLPYVAALLWFTADYIAISWEYGEKSASPSGLPMRYIIKSVMGIGFFLLLLAAIARACEALVYLFGAPNIQNKTRYAHSNSSNEISQGIV